jgi:predicted Zn-dependent protease
MKTTSKRRRATAEQIARAGERGEDVTKFFSGKGRMMPALQRPDVRRVNVDFTVEMLNELDAEARRLNISRQAVIKTMINCELEQRALARSARKKIS